MTYSVRLSAIALVPAVALALSACDVKKTEEGEMPKVEGGKLPKYDVDAPEVKVEKKTVTVPDVDIVTPDEKKQGGNVEPGDAGSATTPPAPAPSAPPAQ